MNMTNEVKKVEMHGSNPRPLFARPTVAIRKASRQQRVTTCCQRAIIDQRGNLCTNQEFDTVVHITLPESGRSQVLKGP